MAAVAPEEPAWPLPAVSATPPTSARRRNSARNQPTPRQLARQLRAAPTVGPPPKSFDVVYKRTTRDALGTHLIFGNLGGHVRTPGGTTTTLTGRACTPNSTTSGQSGLQHAHQWQHTTARDRGPAAGHFLGRTREHMLATQEWGAQNGETPVAPLARSLKRTPSRALRATFSPRAFRQAFAQREGRAVEDEAYYQARRQARVLLHSEELATREAGWSKCKPWVDANAKPCKAQWQTKLEAGRREMKKIEQKRELERTKYENKTRKLLKDCGFLLERMADHEEMHTMQAKAQLADYTGFITQTNTILRNGEMTCKAKFLQVETFHRIIRKYISNPHHSLISGGIPERLLVHAVVVIFELMDEDGGGVLDRDEVRSLARAMGVKLTDGELRDAMAEMDEDGSGEVDFEEFYQWWTVDREAAGSVMAASLSDDKKQEAFEITPLEYM